MPQFCLFVLRLLAYRLSTQRSARPHALKRKKQDEERRAKRPPPHKGRTTATQQPTTNNKCSRVCMCIKFVGCWLSSSRASLQSLYSLSTSWYAMVHGAIMVLPVLLVFILDLDRHSHTPYYLLVSRMETRNIAIHTHVYGNSEYSYTHMCICTRRGRPVATRSAKYRSGSMR
jgi:hypothetical protein